MSLSTQMHLSKQLTSFSQWCRAHVVPYTNKRAANAAIIAIIVSFCWSWEKLGLNIDNDNQILMFVCSCVRVYCKSWNVQTTAYSMCLKSVCSRAINTVWIAQTINAVCLLKQWSFDWLIDWLSQQISVKMLISDAWSSGASFFHAVEFQSLAAH